MHLIGLPVITKADLSSCTSLARIRYLNRFVFVPETCSYATETLGGSQIATIFQESVGSDDADSQDVKKSFVQLKLARMKLNSRTVVREKVNR